MKIAAAFFFMLMACNGCTAADPPLNVEPDVYTHISPAVRQDMLKTARKLFKAATGCRRITQIDITVKNIRMMFSTETQDGKKEILNGKTLHPLPSGGFLLDEQEIPPDGYVQENDEIWQVTGCETRRDFTVKFFGDDRGSTYFNVFDREKNPPPEE